jgi:predicted TIM-barrel fold metal-dependent hydrolase
MALEEPQRTKRLTLDDVLVVDADVHVDDPPGALAPYCDMPWRRSLEYLGEGGPYTYLDIPGYAPSYLIDPLFPGGRQFRSVRTPTQMHEELSALSVDIGILFPDNLLLLAALPDADYASALARAYNRWLTAEWLSLDSLYGAVMVAPQDPAHAAEEIRRYAGDPKMVAVYLPTAAVHPLWGHRCYDPIYDAAQETGLPVMLHSVSTISPRFPFNLDQFESAAARHIIAHSVAITVNLIDMITTGVPARFPELKICFTESGISWVPYLMWRLDKEYAEVRREMPHLKDKPSTYIRQMFFATQPIEEPDDPKQLVAMLDTFDGENRVIFASDWPHHDFDHPRQVFDLPLSNEAKRKIMGENALRLFGISVDRPGS